MSKERSWSGLSKSDMIMKTLSSYGGDRPLKYVYRLVVPVIGIGILIVGWIKYQESSGIFFPTKFPRSRIDELPESVEFVTFESTDGVTISGLYKRGRSDSPVMVFTHGNAGHMINRLPWLLEGVPDGWTGLIVDYRGYGLSDGTPSVSGVKRDSRAAAEYALDRSGSNTLYLYGRSLGVPLAAYVSQFHRTEGIILESGFPSAREVAPHFFPLPGVQYLVSTDLETVRYIEEAEETYGPMRKLVIHGTADEILPVSLGKSLFGQLSEPKDKLIVDGAGHNNLRAVAGERYHRVVQRFLTGERTKDKRQGGSL